VGHHTAHAIQRTPVALCLERTKGPLVSALHQYDSLGLFPRNPLMLARYRKAFTPRRATDDPSDAALQLELLLTHRDKLQPLQPQSPTMRALPQLVAHRRRGVGDTVRHTNRLTSPLKHSGPHVLHGLQEQDTALFWALLRRWPTRTAVPRARRATLATFVRAHHVRYAAVIAQRIQAIKAAPLTTDEGVIAPKARLVQALVAQLRGTLQASADFDAAIAQCAQRHPAFPCFQALPGAGPVFASRLLVACGEHHARDASAVELQNYAGIALVTERSGQKSGVHWRLQCPQFLRHRSVGGNVIPRA
jgi:transposase